MELVDNKNMYGFKGMKRCEDKKVRNKFVGIVPLKILQLYGINQCKSTVFARKCGITQCELATLLRKKVI